MNTKVLSVVEWLDAYLFRHVWDNPRHAETNLITCGFTAEAAHEAVETRKIGMCFKEE